MGNACSFLSIVGGHDKRERNRAEKCILLLSCHGHVTGHHAMLAFHDINNEVELIVALASPRRQGDKLKVKDS